MACYNPIHGYQRQDGRFTLNAKYGVRKLSIPCSGCVGCRLRRAGEWTVRGSHESSLYLDNSFITLTYDDKRLPIRPDGHIPANVGLYYPDFQDFMKRLRERFGPDIRFMCAGEYGETNPVTKVKDGGLYRPHFHAILFNFNFPDRKSWYRTKHGHQVSRSKALEELWPWGNSDIGTVTPQSIGYVARYVMKKVNGNKQDAHYRWVDPDTGEIFYRRPDFCKYSLKPGIGAEWFSKFYASVYPHDYVVFNGKKIRPPRYYDKLYERMTGQCIKRDVSLSNGEIVDFDIQTFSPDFEAIKLSRIETAEKFLDDCTPERLYVREQVALAKTSRLVRKLT